MHAGMMALGIAAQALFAARVLWQWVASERAGESVVPRVYWLLSLAGSALLIGYAAATRDPIFLASPVINLGIYARNLHLSSNRPPSAETLASRGPLSLSKALFVGPVVLVGVVLTLLAKTGLWGGFVVERDLGWFAIGAAGQAVWMLRFPLQWWLSERLGRSVLPAAFWWASIAGSLLLGAYAVHRRDPVFVVAYLLNPIPYVRNLMLIARAERTSEVTP